MKVCVRAHDVGCFDSVTLAEKVKALGFDGVQLVTNKALTDKPLFLNDNLCTDISTAFSEKSLDISMLGAYFNPVHSDEKIVEKGIMRFKNHLLFAKDLGCKFVGSETGSKNDDKWTYNPLNRTDESYKKVKEVFGELAKYSLQTEGYLAIEGAFGHCCYSPEVLAKLVEEIDNGRVFVTVDLYNYLDVGNFRQQREILDRCIDIFGDKIVIFHLKDFVPTGDRLVQTPLGEGILDYDYFMPKVLKNCPNATLVFEGEKLEKMPKSLEFVKRYMK